ncbi:MAG: hypothetical protein KJ955_02425 [Nanoarchaeota archaeon]|nr:hypothetical protein [Nanoarchaeota archaeon]
MEAYQTTAIIKAGETGIDRLVAAQYAEACIERVSAAYDISPYETQLGASQESDKTAYRKSTGLAKRVKRILLMCVGKAEPIKPSERTLQLERILMADKEMKTSAAVFKEIPPTIKRNTERYDALVSQEQKLVAKISGDTADYESAEKDRVVIGSILDYAALSDESRKSIGEAVMGMMGLDVDISDAETRQMAYTRLSAENKSLIEKIEINFPFDERELASARRQMQVIKQYDEKKVRKGFIPAMDKLHELMCELNEAMNKADVEGPGADLEGISERCGQHIAELKAMREQKEAEAELEIEVVKEMEQLEPAPQAEEDIKLRMYRALGLDSAQYSAPVAEEPVIIEADFTEVKL